jgi:hypothetical protein
MPKTMKGVLDVYRELIDPAFQAVEDSQGVLLTAEVRPGGVALHAESELRSGTPTAGALKGAKASAFKDLGKFPAGQVFYSGMDLGPAVGKFAGKAVLGISGDPDSKEAKALAEAVEDFYKAGPTEMQGSMTYPVAAVQVYATSSPDKVVAAQLKMFQAMASGGAFMNLPFKGKPEVKEKAVKYKDYTLNSAHFAFDIDKMLANIPAPAGGGGLTDAQRKALADGTKKLMGDEMTVWFGTDGKTALAVTAKDFPTAQKLLDQYFEGKNAVGDDKNFADARKELPAEATVLLLMDVVQYSGVLLDFVKPLIEASAPPGAMKLPQPIKGKSGFIGVAVTLAPERGSADLFVSSTAVKEIYTGYVQMYLGR